MARNTLGDLNNHLFMMLEKLNDDDITGDNLEQEINRANAITRVSSQIISNANLVLKAKIQSEEVALYDKQLPKMLEG